MTAGNNMTDKDNTTQRIEALHIKVKDLLSKHCNETDIIKALESEGLAPDYILTIIDNIGKEKSDRIHFRKSILSGCFYTLGGLLLSCFSYRIAEYYNAFFFYVYWGIVAFGISTIIRAYIIYKK